MLRRTIQQLFLSYHGTLYWNCGEDRVQNYLQLSMTRFIESTAANQYWCIQCSRSTFAKYATTVCCLTFLLAKKRKWCTQTTKAKCNSFTANESDFQSFAMQAMLVKTKSSRQSNMALKSTREQHLFTIQIQWWGIMWSTKTYGMTTNKESWILTYQSGIL